MIVPEADGTELANGIDQFMMSVTIDRHERDVLRSELDCLHGNLGDVAMGVQHGQRHTELLARVRVGLHLLDDVGWPHDDPRRLYELTLPRERLVAWLRELRESNRHYAANTHQTPEHARVDALAAIARGWTSDSPEVVAAELHASTTRAVDGALDVITVTAAILQRMEADR